MTDTGKHGRHLLPCEVIHHINLDPTDNDPDNLIVLDDQTHALLHLFLQLALVKLMECSDLRQLTDYLVKYIKDNPNVCKNRKRKYKVGLP